MTFSARYGKDEIEKWRFEGWNEPDTKKHWDYPLNSITTKGYLNYWDTTSAALNSTNQELIFGGAGMNKFLAKF